MVAKHSMDLRQITDRLKNLPTRNKPYIFFLHIPKTGGTSVIYALRKKYPFNFFKIEAGSSLRAAEKNSVIILKASSNATIFVNLWQPMQWKQATNVLPDMFHIHRKFLTVQIISIC